jgi:alpha-galactosidase
MSGTPTTDPMRQGEPRDEKGGINSNKYFPDMKALTDHIHSKGLKAGIYSSPGPLTCAKNIASYQHEAVDARKIADWGFDFLKYDWCSYGKIDPKPDAEGFRKPYRTISDALKAQKRDIVLNLCQYGMGNVWEWGRDVGGNSWRTAGDLGGMSNICRPNTRLYRDLFDLYASKDLYEFAKPGSWNDPDYLLLGKLWVKDRIAPTPLTANEQYTQVSICALHAAPMIFTGDMTQLDDFTLGLLCNSEVIDVDQDSLGHAAQRVAKLGDTEVWARDLEDGSRAVGLFNWGETDANVPITWAELGIKGRQVVRDLWRQMDLGTFDAAFSSSIGPHGVTFIRIRPEQN